MMSAEARPARRPAAAVLERLTAAGVARRVLEYEKAHTYPASRPFFGPMDARTAFARLPDAAPPFWAYVHVPFCNYMCSFCFYRKVLAGQLDTAFPMLLDGIRQELGFVRRVSERPLEVHDLYIGGGTPTALSWRQLESLLDLLHENLTPSPDYLGTCECSPESLTRDKCALVLERGLSRLSLGGQSLDQTHLDATGRRHRADEIAGAYDLLRASGCDHVNLDLIYGFPGQTVADWERELHAVLRRLQPESLTLYYLRYVPGTPLADAAASPDRVSWSDLIAMRQVYFEVLENAGYERCRPHHFRRPLDHVRRYRGAPTFDRGNEGRQIGFGPSAYSHVGDRVSRNGWPIADWTGATRRYGFGTAEGRTLTAADRRTRALVKAFSDTLATDRDTFREETGDDLDAVFRRPLAQLADLDLVERTSDGYRLTELGVLVDEEILYFLYPLETPYGGSADAAPAPWPSG